MTGGQQVETSSEAAMKLLKEISEGFKSMKDEMRNLRINAHNGNSRMDRQHKEAMDAIRAIDARLYRIEPRGLPHLSAAELQTSVFAHISSGMKRPVQLF